MSIGIDNSNFLVINRSLVQETMWCTKSLRASDVIGIYWPENWDALSPPELRVPSWSSFPCFLPPCNPSPLNRHSTSIHPSLSALSFLSFSRDMPRYSSVRIHLSLPRLSGVCIQDVVEHGYIREYSKKLVVLFGIAKYSLLLNLKPWFSVKSFSVNLKSFRKNYSKRNF